MQATQLPPLDLLLPFEAAARHGSFTRAADELAVTQSAVSQRVRKLEDLLGVELFERQHRAISLTPQGRELLNGVTVALRHLCSATDGLRQHGGRSRVKLGVDTSIAQLWLPNRMAQIMAGDGDFDIDLTVSDTEAQVLDADIAVIHGAGQWPGYTAELLFQDEVFPVCAPSFLQRFAISDVQDLRRAHLIDLDYVHWNWINWRIWFTEAKLPYPQARPVLRTNSYGAVLEYARAGLGVALGWQHLLAEDLHTGALVRPVPQTIMTEFGYYLLLRDAADDTAQRVAEQLLKSI